MLLLFRDDNQQSTRKIRTKVEDRRVVIYCRYVGMILNRRYVKGPEANITGMDQNVKKERRKEEMGPKEGSVFNRTSKIKKSSSYDAWAHNLW